ncbi:MAG TPA: hypothetical protein VEP49_20245 [Acidimicrobiia bacterium]|nr:hypothetical protein [Acidimicrobiia bacterium]
MSGEPSSWGIAKRAVRIAFGVYGRHPIVIAGIAIVVFAPIALIDAAASEEAAHLVSRGGRDAFVGVVVFLATAVVTAGTAVGAGMMHRFVATDFGGPVMTVGQALRSLPKARILGVDLAVSGLVAIASVVGAIPGLLVYTLFCLAGALLVDENLRVREAMARSVALTRRHFFVTVMVVTVPVVLEHEVINALEVLWDFPFAVLFGAHLVAAVLVLAPVVLVEIALALTLKDDKDDTDDKEVGDASTEPVPL